MNIQRVAIIFDNTLRRETTGIYCRRALGELVEVEHFLPSALDRIPREGFDFYLNIDDGFDYELPDDLRPSAFWAIDTHIEFQRSLKKARKCDFTFAAQKDGAERLLQAGVRNVQWLPLACDPELHGKQPAEKQYDVGFVGNLFPGAREELMWGIQAEFPNTFVGNRYFEEMAAVYSASRIVFNRSIVNDVNMRVFEALCSGSLLITNDLSENGQSDLLQDGVHLVTYEDGEDLLSKIRWYLEHEKDRERIAASGRREVLARHTYRHRMQILLNAIERASSPPLHSAASAKVAEVATSSSHHGSTRPVKGNAYFEFARPEVLALIPLDAKNVLDVGCGAGRLGATIKQRQIASVNGIELSPTAAAIAGTRLDEVTVGNIEGGEIDFPDGLFDCVICADVLEHMRRPRPVLEKMARWMSPGGVLIASIPNSRNHTVIQGLLEGNFTYEPAGLLDEDHVRLFTRREIEKLFFRAGFAVARIDVVPGPGHREWELRGQPGEVEAGHLRVGGLSPQDAEDFYVYQFLVTATPIQPRLRAIQCGTNLIDHSVDQSERIRSLAKMFPWPDSTPVVPIPAEHTGWLGDGAREQLSDVLNTETRIVVELGAWLGTSTRFIADRAPNATVITVDHWHGSPEHWQKPHWQSLLPQLFETFQTMCWDYRDRIIPLKMTTLEGLKRISDAGLEPDVIYVDAEHAYESVSAELEACRSMFPNAVLVGDDYDEPSVERAVREFADRQGMHVETKGAGWRGWRLGTRTARVSDVPVKSIESLTSIILVTHNQFAYTHQCLESIRFLTDEPYELIVVDNGSTDGTVEMLRGRDDVQLIENSENRGFPAAVNQGIQASRGQNILLLNNDTLVTTGWLRRLLDALHADGNVGLVGPCSNSVSGPQQVSVSYWDLSGLDGFAWEWGKTHHGRRAEVDRLVGFCLLFKREVFEKIGLLDERFGIGNFEDDDYCRRALQAGYRCVIAQDAFIHHFGGTTFRASGVDFARLMAENERKYNDKWQEQNRDGQSDDFTNGDPPQQASLEPAERPNSAPSLSIRVAPDGGLLLERATAIAGVQNVHSDLHSENHKASAPQSAIHNPQSEINRSPGGAPRPAPRLSLCMIVRDNEDTIRPCLESIKPFVDEMIVVDTGSQDATPKIAAELGARVYEFPWCDDFSAARNESLKYALGEWIFWMDSDDTIPPGCGRKLRELVDWEHPDNVLGYVMQVHCPGAGDNGQHDVTAVDHVKLFRNRADLRFEFCIHEQILPAIRRAGGNVAFTDVYVVHSGSDHSEKGRAGKFDRDFRILAKDLAERPDHPFILFNLGMTYADAEQYDEAIAHLERCIAVSTAGESHLRKAYALLVNSQNQAGRHKEACQSCGAGLELFPDDPELLFRSGMLHHQHGRLDEAELAYRQVLAGTKARHFASLDTGIGGYKARHNLALVYEDMDRPDKAEAEWRNVTEEEPAYRLGWRGLVRTLIEQSKLGEAKQIASILLESPPASVSALRCEGFILNAKIALREGDIDRARQFLDEACQQFLDDLEPLRELCELLYTFRPGDDAIVALERLAALDPTDGAAPHNLGTLHLREGRTQNAIDAFEESLRRRPKCALTAVQLGYALHDNGKFEEAESAWRRALELDPAIAAARAALDELSAVAT